MFPPQIGAHGEGFVDEPDALAFLDCHGGAVEHGVRTVADGEVGGAGDGIGHVYATRVRGKPGATLQLESIGGIIIGPEALTLSGTGVGGQGALSNKSGVNTFGGLITLAAPTTITSTAGTLNLTNPGTHR